MAGGADSVWEVSRSQLAGPGRTPLCHHLSILYTHIHTRVQQCTMFSAICLYFNSQHGSFKFHGNMLLVMAGVLTGMLHSSGAGRCTLVGNPNKNAHMCFIYPLLVCPSETLCLIPCTAFLQFHLHGGALIQSNL